MSWGDRTVDYPGRNRNNDTPAIRLMVSPSARAKTMFYYVHEIGSFQQRPDPSLNQCPTPSYMILYTYSGHGALAYGGIEYTLLPGHVLFIDCTKTVYSFSNRYEHWHAFWFRFNGCSSSGYFDHITNSRGPVHRLESRSPIPLIMEQLLEQQRQEDSRTEVVSSHLITHILTELMLLSGELEEAPAPGMMPVYIRRAVDYIDTHYAEGITIARLSKLCSVSKYHLAHEFKKYTGFAPNKYVIHVRIRETKRILKDTDLPITEIAARAGIESVTHFISQFKREVGWTPLAYRKRYRQSPTPNGC